MLVAREGDGKPRIFVESWKVREMDRWYAVSVDDTRPCDIVRE